MMNFVVAIKGLKINVTVAHLPHGSSSVTTEIPGLPLVQMVFFTGANGFFRDELIL